MNQKLGQHIFVDAWGCTPSRINDPRCVEAALRQAVKDGGATLIDLCTHEFSPQGVTATATLAESHIAIHTWPEHGYFAADLFFCGSLDPKKGVPAILAALGATKHRLREIERGFHEAPADVEASMSSSEDSTQ